MSVEVPRFTDRVQDLRHAFDRSFAEAPDAREAQYEHLLSLRVDRDPYAVELAQISGLFADTAITRVPSDVPELIGIAGFRGVIVPVYDLRVLLGYAGGELPRWLIVAAGATSIGLAFDQFDGHVRLPRESADTADDAHRQHVRRVVRTGELLRPVVHVPSILESIVKRARRAPPRKEP